MIITVAEHQHIKNNYVCSFCENKSKPVVGRAYMQNRYNYPDKNYLFEYCADCGIAQAENIARLVHPDYRVTKDYSTLAAENASLRDALSRLVEAVKLQRECRGVEFDLTIDEPFRTHAIYEIVQSNIAAGDEITRALSAADDAMKDCG